MINLPKLPPSLRGGAGHAAQTSIEPEKPLKTEPGICILGGIDFKGFFGLDRLVQSVSPGAVGHEPTGKLIHDDHFAVINDIVFVQQV